MNALKHLSAVGLQWESPRLLGVALLVAVLGVLGVLLLYARQVRNAPGRMKWVMPALRCLAVVALAASIARPVSTRILAEEEQGAIVVVVDRSLSMSVRDTQRTPAMLVALADGMGKLAAGVRARPEAFLAVASDMERLPGLVAEIAQAQVELEVAQIQGKENPGARRRFEEGAAEWGRLAKSLSGAQPRLKLLAPRLAVALAALERKELAGLGSRLWLTQVGRLIDEIAARAAQFQTESDEALYKAEPQVRRICDDLAKLNRIELVEEALVDSEAGLLAKLPARTPVYGFSFGPEVKELPLRAMEGEKVRNVRRLLLNAVGARSDITGGLQEILERMRGQPVQAVVVLSEGQQVGAEAAVSSSLVGGTGVPVFAVSPAPGGAGGTPVRDLAVQKVTTPASVFVGETLTLTADVRWSGLPRGKVPEVTVRVGDQEYAGEVKPKEKEPGAGQLRFQVIMRETGPQRLTVNLVPVEGEITTDNNSATRYVKVLSDRFEVLLVGGAPTWDYRYLRNALMRTNWINARAVMLEKQGSMLGVSPEQLAALDVVILCDAPAKGLSAEQWEGLRKMVSQRGGSVILMAGRAHLPREYTSDALAEFLPWKRTVGRAGGGAGGGAVWRVWPGEEAAFRVVPALGGSASGSSVGAGGGAGVSSASGISLAEALTLDEGSATAGADLSQRWMGLPPIFRYLSMPERKEITEAVLVESNTGAPVLTRHRLGRGSVFFLGIDETWRWRAKGGEHDQEKFFQQLVRAAADEPYAATEAAISLDADRVVIAPGESVRVRARLNEPPREGAYPAMLGLEVVQGDQVIKLQALSAVGSADSGRYEGAVSNLPVGDYVLRARTPEGVGAGSEVEYPLHVAENSEAEMANLTPDEELLRRLTAPTGGDFRTLEQLRDLPGRLAAVRQRAAKTAQVRLWSSWYLYAFVVGCLGLEWALRKKAGMA